MYICFYISKRLHSTEAELLGSRTCCRWQDLDPRRTVLHEGQGSAEGGTLVRGTQSPFVQALLVVQSLVASSIIYKQQWEKNNCSLLERSQSFVSLSTSIPSQVLLMPTAVPLRAKMIQNFVFLALLVPKHHDSPRKPTLQFHLLRVYRTPSLSITDPMMEVPPFRPWKSAYRHHHLPKMRTKIHQSPWLWESLKMCWPGFLAPWFCFWLTALVNWNMST